MSHDEAHGQDMFATEVFAVDRFVADGYAVVRRSAPRAVAEAAQAILWDRLGLPADDPSAWTDAVRWTSDLTGDGPFAALMSSPRLAAALDAVCGRGGWQPRDSLGMIPVRFPVSPAADDRGWHLDHNTVDEDGDWTRTGRPQTLLALTLLSDVGPDDAPTRLRRGSHRDVAAALARRDPHATLPDEMIAAAGFDRPVDLATGSPGDVYLVHPFTVHAADEHRGRTPRFVAQTPVLLTAPLTPATPGPLAAAFPPTE